MAHLMQQLAEAQGFCCVKEQMQHYRNESSEEVATELGVSCRAVRYWRKRIADGENLCKELSTCKLPNPESPLSDLQDA